MKLNVAILKKKYGPLPVWGWAILFAGVIFLLWRHAKNSGGSQQQSSMTMGTDQAATAPGDMSTADVPGNAGDTGTSTPDVIDSGGLGGDFTDGGGFGGSLDGGQGDTTSVTPAAAVATLGLAHIFGDYWYDSSNGKLVKIPGSGGAKKGSGKKVAHKGNKKAGKAGAKAKTGSKSHTLARSHIRTAKNPANKRNMQSPKPTMKRRVLPRPTVPALKPRQQRAVDRAHHPTGRATPVVKPAARKQIRVLPKRPAQIQNRRRPR